MGIRCSPAAGRVAAIVASGISRAAIHAGPPSKAVHGRAVVHVAALRAAVGEQTPSTSLLGNTKLSVGSMHQSVDSPGRPLNEVTLQIQHSPPRVFDSVTVQTNTPA